MRHIFIPALGLALVATAPAFAQSSQSSSPQQGQGSQAQSGVKAHAMTQDNLRKQLQQAGFKNIQILDAAYLVQAQTAEGDTVFMTINPPMMAGSSSASGSSGSGSGQSGSARQ